MKKHVIIFLLLVLYLSPGAQKGFVRTISTPCTGAMTDTIIGKWINPANTLSANGVANSQEVGKRLNAINSLVMVAYPAPSGADAAWGGTSAKTTLANQVKFVMAANGKMEEQIVKANPVSTLVYNLILYPY